MKTTLYPDLQAAMMGLCEKLKIEIDSNLQHEYQSGKHPDLLSYEKVDTSPINLPTIQKYLIGAQTILNQPCQFYDIGRACRHFFFVQILNKSVDSVIKKVSNHEERLDALLKETTFDPFESVLYELAVAAQYANTTGVTNVRFLSSSSKKTPEFEFLFNNKKVFVECKKFDRDTNIASKMRNEVRKKAQLTLHSFFNLNQSAIIEASFHKDPENISDTLIRDICIEALKKRKTIVDKSLTVKVILLPPQRLKNYQLFPSPEYFWKRYKYRNHGEWFGITNILKARFAQFTNATNDGTMLPSSWLDETDFECVFKWKITDQEIVWRYKRLGYNRLFKGLEQLQSYGNNSVLHAWYERDGFAGHRRDELLHFFNKIKSNSRDVFSWIIFNETILDTSVKGVFDLIEHAHPICGPTAQYMEPVVTNVFINENDCTNRNSKFGVGAELPDIDEITE